MRTGEDDRPNKIFSDLAPMDSGYRLGLCSRVCRTGVVAVVKMTFPDFYSPNELYALPVDHETLPPRRRRSKPAHRVTVHWMEGSRITRTTSEDPDRLRKLLNGVATPAEVNAELDRGGVLYWSDTGSVTTPSGKPTPAPKKTRKANKGNARLTADQVLQIRASDAKPADLAQRYGVSSQTIVRVLRRECWATIE